MGIFEDKKKYIYPTSKDGSPVVVTITGAMKRIESDNPKMTYKDKNKNDLKYFDVLPVVDEEGNEAELKISTWKVYFGIKNLNPDIGDTIVITHPKNGEYIVTKK